MNGVMMAMLMGAVTTLFESELLLISLGGRGSLKTAWRYKGRKEIAVERMVEEELDQEPAAVSL